MYSPEKVFPVFPVCVIFVQIPRSLERLRAMAMTYGIREPEEELKTAGLKATAPRMKILKSFRERSKTPKSGI